MFMGRYDLPICPIDDTQEPKDTSQSEDNKSRCKLASLFRLLDVRGWSQHIYNQCSTRCTQVPTQFYTNPFGLNFSEITASKIIKLDFNGNIVSHGITDYGYNLPGFYLQQAIYESRSDVNCIIQMHEPIFAGISATKQGFLPLSVEGLACSDISYMDFGGDFHSSSFVTDLVKTLGPKNRILVLRNHGVVVCGSTLEETAFLFCQLLANTKTQMVASVIVKDLNEMFILPLTDVVAEKVKMAECYHKMNAKSTDNIIWKTGELEYEAEMRRLDSMGFKTGYPYKKKFHVQAVFN